MEIQERPAQYEGPNLDSTAVNSTRDFLAAAYMR